MAENDERLTPFEGETPKSLLKYHFQTISDYTRQLKAGRGSAKALKVLSEDAPAGRPPAE